jgi:C4-dicarboxylate-specific signal transduction histidine kinase
MAGGDGRASRLVLIRDITERVEAEQREAALSAQLEHTQKLEAVGRLAGGVAHDFNNVLTAVSGYADFIEEFDDPEAAEIAAELRTTSRRGAALTRQLLAFARRDAPNMASIDLAEVLRGAGKLVTRLFAKRTGSLSLIRRLTAGRRSRPTSPPRLRPLRKPARCLLGTTIGGPSTCYWPKTIRSSAVSRAASSATPVT